MGDQGLDDWAQLALGHAGPGLRKPLADLLLFDRRLARIVLSASEPALAQIRLAWWREELAREREGQPPPPDPLLASLLDSWRSEIPVLIGLIDGWETLLPTDDDQASAAELLSDTKAASFAALARFAGVGEREADAALHGKLWGLAELALSEGRYGKGALQESRLLATNLPRLPKSLRALAVIGGLSRRSLLRGGAPLLGDRFSPFAAMRLGIFGT